MTVKGTGRVDAKVLILGEIPHEADLRRATLEIARKRFETKFTVTPGCWLWNTALNPKGYGRFFFDGWSMCATRFAYELYVGPFPQHLHIMHKCDNPRCVNPDHLQPGTQTDNMQDAKKKGRTCTGAKNGHYKHGLRCGETR